jgi:putrescine carbamoyltransferase
VEPGQERGLGFGMAVTIDVAQQGDAVCRRNARAAFMPKFQVNADLLSKAPATARFMHCLPASRGVEATDEVMDGPQSIIYDQSENRLHTEKALLVWFVYPRLKRASDSLIAHHRGLVEAFLG